jgi:DNA-binding transcriptional LysR family regulator
MHSQLRDVEYFAAIAEHGQLQRAAETLGLSQAALSKSLSRLETAMNSKLFRRTPKGVELTSVGSALLARVGKLRLSMEDVTREIADLSEGRAGHLRIGTVAGGGLHLVPVACEALLKESPRVTFKILVQETNLLLAGLRNGELDLAMANLEGVHDEDVIEEQTHEEVQVIYAAAGHRLAKRKSLTLADLAAERWAMPSANSVIVRVLSVELRKKGLPPPVIAVETTNLPARYHFVGATDLLAINPREMVHREAARHGLVELRVKDLTLKRRGGVIYRKDAYLSPAARRLITLLKEKAKQLWAEG